MFRPLGIATFVLILHAASAALPGDDAARGKTLLLVDDHEVLYRSGTTRVLHPAEKHPFGPVIVEDKPWEVAIGWTSIYRDPATGKYQLWYQAYSGAKASEKAYQCVVCYAESDDGLHFNKPQLDLFSYNGESRTNIVLIGNGGYGDRYGCAVLVEPHDPDPARRYKMAYYDWSGESQREAAGLYLAFSSDGIHWTRQPGPLVHTNYGGRGMQPPLSTEDPFAEQPYKESVRKTWRLPLTMSDAVDLIYDPRRQRYVIYGKMWIQGPDGSMAWKHAMGRIDSADLRKWSKAELLLTPDDHDPPELEFHTTPVFYYQGAYLGLNQILNRREGGTMNVELITSRNGKRFERPFRDQWFIARGGGDDFDGGSIFSNATPVVLDDEIRFYYGAYGQGAVGGGSQITSDEQQSGVGLARIPRDRFAGITTVPVSNQPTLRQPLHHIGQVTLRPRELAGVRSISVNADARDGSVRVELLDSAGYRLPGFTRDDAQPLTGDNLRHAAAWNNARLADLPPGKYAIRLHLNQATVYALTLD